MSYEATGRDTRMTALHNVTVNNGRRGSKVRRGSLIDETQTDRLTTNRNLLLKNVSATPQLLSMCEEQGVITHSQREVIETAEDDGEKRMLLLLNSMHLQETTVFRRFCEVLTMSGHPLIADYLRDSGLASRTFNFEDLWEQHPSLTKHLHKWEKEKLETYITAKIKEEVMRFNMGEIQEDREKEVDMRLKQVQQSWKFQKEIREKEGVLTTLQKRVIELEKLLVEKEHDASNTRMNLQRDIEKLSSNVQVAAKFNMANDSALRRLQESVNLYTAFAGHLENRLGEFDPAAVARRKKQPLIREETSLDNLQKEFDTGRRIQHLQQMVGHMLHELEHLRDVKRQYELLLETVNFLLSQMKSSVSSEHPDGAEYSQTLRHAFSSLVLRHDEQMERQKAETELLRRFIKGLLTPDEVPEDLKGIPLPGEERDTLNVKIRALEVELQKVKAEKQQRIVIQAAPTVENPLPPQETASYSHARPVPPLVPSTGKKEPRRSSQPVNIPFSYHSRRVPREAKPRPDPKPPNAKLLSMRAVNFM